MSFLPSVLQKLLIAETESDQPVSSSIIQKVGGSINSIVDRFDSIVKFNSSGTFDVPLSTRMIYAMVVGGGGGGGGTVAGQAFVGRGGGGGGGGGGIALGLIEVTPGQTLTITVGAGGVGGTNASGGDGGVSSIQGSGVFFRADGGGGGGGGPESTTSTVAFAKPGKSTRFARGGAGTTRNIILNDPTVGQCGGGASGSPGGNGGGYAGFDSSLAFQASVSPNNMMFGVSGGGGAGGSFSLSLGYSYAGGASIFATGGSHPITNDIVGGGGGAAFGNGGSGGTPPNGPGGSAASNSGAGGGGGAGASALTASPSTGGNGGSGVVWIFLSGA